MAKTDAPQQTEPKPAPHNTSPQLPPFPPNREVREGDIPRKK